MSRLLVSGIALLVLGFLAPVTGNAAKKVYVLGVVPQMPPVTMYTNWTPVIERLMKDTGEEIKLKVYERMSDFESDYSRGVPDLIFANPTQTVAAFKAQGYIPLVRSSKRIAGIVFVRNDSDVRTIKDLKHRNVAFVGSRNVCSLIVRHGILKENVSISLKSMFEGSTKNVFKCVLLGKAEAGATLDVDLEKEQSDVSGQLRVIMRTPEFASHPLSAHPRVPLRMREKLSRAVLRLAKDSEGLELLRTARLSDPVPAEYNRDYAALEEIDVEKLAAEK